MIKFRKINHDVESLLPVLVERLVECPEIDLLYLYGSRAGGRVSPLSDVDLAVLLTPRTRREQYLDIQLKLIGIATEALRTDEAELHILNNLPVQAQYAMLKKKRVFIVS